MWMSWSQVVNESFNPYLDDLTSSELDIMYVNADGTIGCTSGRLQDSKANTFHLQPPEQNDRRWIPDNTKPVEPDAAGDARARRIMPGHHDEIRREPPAVTPVTSTDPAYHRYRRTTDPRYHAGPAAPPTVSPGTTDPGTTGSGESDPGTTEPRRHHRFRHEPRCAGGTGPMKKEATTAAESAGVGSEPRLSEK